MQGIAVADQCRAVEGLAQDARPRERGGGGGIDQVMDGSALAGLRSGFFCLPLFQEILVAKFFDLGGKWDEKLSIMGEIRGIGARKFVEM
jgi:hypothetical protein